MYIYVDDFGLWTLDFINNIWVLILNASKPYDIKMIK